MKRCFDFIVAAILLISLSAVLVVLYVLIAIKTNVSVNNRFYINVLFIKPSLFLL